MTDTHMIDDSPRHTTYALNRMAYAIERIAVGVEELVSQAQQSTKHAHHMAEMTKRHADITEKSLRGLDHKQSDYHNRVLDLVSSGDRPDPAVRVRRGAHHGRGPRPQGVPGVQPDPLGSHHHPR